MAKEMRLVSRGEFLRVTCEDDPEETRWPPGWHAIEIETLPTAIRFREVNLPEHRVLRQIEIPPGLLFDFYGFMGALAALGGMPERRPPQRKRRRQAKAKGAKP